MAAPTVSVVVPTRNRTERLFALLRSLERQDLDPPGGLQVVVVDDASAEALEPARLAEVAPGLDLLVLRHDSPRGPAASRNTGWRAASAPLIAFTDDDCEAEPGWLSALLRAVGRRDDVIVQGATNPLASELDRLGPFSRTQEINGPDGLYETCNLAVPRRLLERLGGFDETFKRPCGEDVDLGLRAGELGATLEFARDARVFHAVHEPGILATVRGMPMWTDAVRVLKMHPELREQLLHRLFWKPSHPPLILALAGVAFAGRHRQVLPLALIGPYLEHHRRTHARAGRPARAVVRWLPAHLAVDLAELVTMLRGSLRYRTLML